MCLTIRLTVNSPPAKVVLDLNMRRILHDPPIEYRWILKNPPWWHELGPVEYVCGCEAGYYEGNNLATVTRSAGDRSIWLDEGSPFASAVQRRVFSYQEAVVEDKLSKHHESSRTSCVPVFITFSKSDHHIRHLFKYSLRSSVHQIQCGLVIWLFKRMRIGESSVLSALTSSTTRMHKD
jgi:hypothetical protein